jgi:hypothetical protein
VAVGNPALTPARAGMVGVRGAVPTARIVLSKCIIDTHSGPLRPCSPRKCQRQPTVESTRTPQGWYSSAVAPLLDSMSQGRSKCNHEP